MKTTDSQWRSPLDARGGGLHLFWVTSILYGYQKYLDGVKHFQSQWGESHQPAQKQTKTVSEIKNLFSHNRKDDPHKMKMVPLLWEEQSWRLDKPLLRRFPLNTAHHFTAFYTRQPFPRTHVHTLPPTPTQTHSSLLIRSTPCPGVKGQRGEPRKLETFPPLLMFETQTSRDMARVCTTAAAAANTTEEESAVVYFINNRGY